MVFRLQGSGWQICYIKTYACKATDEDQISSCCFLVTVFVTELLRTVEVEFQEIYFEVCAFIRASEFLLPNLLFKCMPQTENTFI